MIAENTWRDEPDNSEPDNILNKNIFRELKKLTDTIIRGDYSHAANIEEIIRDKDNPADLVEFAESLNMMTVKLEAREMALKNHIEELESVNQQLANSRSRIELFSTIYTGFLVSTSIFIFLYLLISAWEHGSFVLARFAEIAFLIITVMIIRKSRMPLSFFGATLKGAGIAARESFLFSALICAGMIAVKIHLNRIGVKGFEDVIFVTKNINLELLVYLPIATLQEFMTRGIAQTTVENVMLGKYRKFYAILTVSCLFGLSHIQFSVTLALISLVFGLFWGFMFFRHRTIVGVALSHFMIGGTAYILGFWEILSKG